MQPRYDSSASSADVSRCNIASRSAAASLAAWRSDVAGHDRLEVGLELGFGAARPDDDPGAVRCAQHDGISRWQTGR